MRLKTIYNIRPTTAMKKIQVAAAAAAAVPQLACAAGAPLLPLLPLQWYFIHLQFALCYFIIDLIHELIIYSRRISNYIKIISKYMLKYVHIHRIWPWRSWQHSNISLEWKHTHTNNTSSRVRKHIFSKIQMLQQVNINNTSALMVIFILLLMPHFFLTILLFGVTRRYHCNFTFYLKYVCCGPQSYN